jgi:aminoglycoside phosphotransferase (APT) family kinase protein
VEENLNARRPRIEGPADGPATRDSRGMDDERRDWVEDVTRAQVVSWSRPATGGSRDTYLVDIAESGKPPSHLVLRVDRGGSFTGTEISLAREGAVFRALEPTRVPVPRVVAVAPDERAVLLQRLEGSDDLSTLDDATRRAALDDFVDVIVKLHSIDVASLVLPGFPRPATAEDNARLDLELWARLASVVEDLDPLIVYAGTYLRAHAPRRVDRTVFVQGDTGPGNFLVHDGRVSGLVDMEFAHFGDPMDDLAWIVMRMGDDPVTTDLLARYEQRSGFPVDPTRLEYYGVAVQYRCAVTTSLAVQRGGGARGWAPYLLATQRFLRGLSDALVTFTGVEDPHVDVAAGVDTPRTAFYDDLEGCIRRVVRGIEDPELREDTRNKQILVRYLRDHDRFGATIEELDRVDLAESLGIAGGARELAAAAETGGAEGDLGVLAYLLRRTRRRATLWRSVLDRAR